MNARQRRRLKTAADARPFDWALLAGMIAVSGGSFAFIRAAVETIPPAAVAAGRLWVAAAVMYAAMRLARRRLPPLVVKTAKGPRLHLTWAYMLAVSAVGYAAPFFIFPWAQQYVESGLAGVYMAFMPLWTLGLAYFFAGEGLTRGKLIGFALGFLGVMILIGPDVIGGAARSSVLAQAALLLATFLYAATVVIARRAPPIRPRVFTAGILIAGALIMTPALFFTDLRPAEWSAASLMSVAALGVGPTALAGLLVIMMVKRVGAGFMALSNYLIPVVAVIVGAIVYHERLGPNVIVALGVILAGVALSQRRRKARPALAGEMKPVAETARDQR